MSALPNPLPEPRRLVPVPPQPRRGGRRWLLLLVLLGAAAGAGWAYLRKPQPLTNTGGPGGPTAAVFKTAAAHKGDLEVRVRLTGVITARNFANISAPRTQGGFMSDRTMNILSVLPAGKFVKKGDVICELDPQRLKDQIDDEQDNLRNAENDVKKKVVQQELDMENLQQNLRVAKASLDKANLDMKANEIRTDIDQELLRLAVEEADAAYKEIQKEIVESQKSQKADLRNTQIAYELQKKRVDRAAVDLAKFSIKAPMDGMIVMMTQMKSMGDQQQIQAGDQVFPGQPFMKIVDPNSMQVETSINQTESGQFRIGQDAVVELDAFPGSRYPARISAIGALASSGGRQQYYIRSVPVMVQILKVDAKMIPDLTASADVLVHKVPNVILAPASSVEREGEKAFVMVKTAEGLERRGVEIGPTNGTHFAILSGLKDGDEVKVVSN